MIGTGRWVFLAWLAALLVVAGPRPAAATSTTAAPPEREILVMIKHPLDRSRLNDIGGSYGGSLPRSGKAKLAREIAQRYGLTTVDDWAMPLVGVDCFVMVVPPGVSTVEAALRVSHDNDVDWAEPVEVYAAQSAPATHNDPLYPAEPAAQQWHLAALHQTANGRGVRVAVVDSGIDGSQPDLAGQLAVNKNFVAGRELTPEQHGTAVAGVIAAKADNMLGIAGVAPGARLLGLRACWQAGPNSTSCDTLSLAKALYYAVENRSDVINLSLAGPNARLLREIISVAYARGIAVVAAFDRRLPSGGFPASVPGVLAVSDAPVAGDGDVYVAPGRGVPTTLPGGRFSIVNGSSFSAAHVSGLVALMLQRKRSAPIALVNQRAGGPIDACATLFRVTGSCACDCDPLRPGMRAAR